MDRVNQLRGAAGGSGDSSLESSPGSEAYLTANESSKYFSLSEVDSSLDLTPVKDVSLTSAADSTGTLTTPDQFSDLSPIGKNNDLLDSYKIGKQIEAANILSGGVDIFDDDNDTSCDGNELIIDDNVADLDEKANEQIVEESEKGDDNSVDSSLVEAEPIPSKDTEISLQIDGKNVNAIDIGNGLYLYRKGDQQEELAAVQIIDSDQPEPSFKFLKVRENSEGNLEVYEEIEVEVPKTPKSKSNPAKNNAAQASINNTNEVASEAATVNIESKIISSPPKTLNTIEPQPGCSKTVDAKAQEAKVDLKTFTTEAKISPLIGFTPMTFHSTPSKEGIPLTKTMVDQHLHPNRHSDIVKKTIEVNTETCKLKLQESPILETADNSKVNDKIVPIEIASSENKVEEKDSGINSIEEDKNKTAEISPEVVVETKSEIPSSMKVEANKETIPAKQIEEMKAVVNDNQVTNKLNFNTASPEKTVTAEATSTTANSENVEKDQKILETANIEPPKDTSNENPTVVETKAEIASLTEKEVTSVKTLQNHDKPADQKTLEKTESKRSEPIDDSQSAQKTEPIALKTQSPPNNTSTPKKEVLVNKTVDKELLPAAAPAPKDNLPTPPKENAVLIKSDKSEEVGEPIKGTGNVTCENNEQKNLSDDLIQLNDLGVETNQDKSLEFLEPKELTDNEMYKPSPVKVAKIENDSKVTTSTPNTIFNAKVKEAIATSLVGSHKMAPTSLPQLLKAEQKPMTSNLDSKTKVFDNNAFVNKYVNKALLIKSVTSGPPGDFKNVAVNKPPLTSVSKDAPIINNAKIVNLADRKHVPIPVQVDTKPKSINNNNAVPFGKWTEANKQAYLNKIKETKVVPNSSNVSQIKQPYDLNRRDVLKKIDSQRQQVSNNTAARNLEAQNKLNIKKETPMFLHKPSLKPDTKVPVKTEPPKPKQDSNIPVPKKDIPETVTKEPNDPSGSIKDQRKVNAQDIINRTIEDILMERKSPNESELIPAEKARVGKKSYSRLPTKSLGLVDDIEMKMNELHGIPNDRCQESRFAQDVKTYTKSTTYDSYEYDSKSYYASRGNKIPSLVPISKPKGTNRIDVDEDEVLEHEPVTGDMELIKTSPRKIARPIPQMPTVATAGAKKEGGITEKDFDKFARRNSITYNDNCISLNYENKQQNVVEDVVLTKYTIGSAHTKSAFNQHLPTNYNTKNHSSKFMPIRSEEVYKSAQNKNNLKTAYHSALTMRQKESPITVIEDKPVKVVFMDSNAEYVTSCLNAQGKELSPAKKPVIPEPDASNHSSFDSLDAEVLEVVDVAKSPEKSQTPQPPMKHQRKQVLTPVETPAFEIVVATEKNSPQKKPKVEESMTNERVPKEKDTSKTVLPKKTYLLGRSAVEEVRAEPQSPQKSMAMSNAASAIDNLVKAAELLETQSKNMQLNESKSTHESSNTPTPIKRGRGRPRKNPLPESKDSPQNKSVNVTSHNKSVNITSPNKSVNLSPQKKRRVSKPKPVSSSEESSDDEDAIVNWTMGKINENIVCPICNKLFRSENVVFKHVKHCSGPSPNRSETTRSSKRTRRSFESNNSSQDISDFEESLNKISETKQRNNDQISEVEKNDNKNSQINKKDETKVTRKSVESEPKVTEEVITIEDTPIKKKIDKPEESKQTEAKPATTTKQKQPQKTNLVCEICGKAFRQLSYLVSHKLTHKKDEPKKPEIDNSGSVFSCEVCKKEFRKLHHLVQHRIIHNPTTSRSRRKSSAEILERKSESSKAEDQSAGFRCEPCDKSFRKLHHLVEHRETHDGINRQKTTSAPIVPEKEKTEAPTPQCNVCNKTFRKLHHLIEHKEQHLEAASEKSDDKSVKSSMSTRDIIHECSLCYMVFPNEHSLTKHSVNCQRKKKQSMSKPSKPENEDSGDDIALSKIAEDAKLADKLAVAEIEKKSDPQSETKPVEVKTTAPVEAKPKEPEAEIEPKQAKDEAPKKLESEPEKAKIIETIVIEDTPKKRVAPKDKVATTVTKRQKSTHLELPVVDENKLSSDDDEIRYMLNPDFKSDESTEGKFFMKVRANKRNSLQIERPNSKNLIKRRVSLQNPPKIPRLKPRKIESIKEIIKPVKTEVPSTDSDDSDVKYSFPESKKDTETEPVVEKKKRKSLTEKRKSLVGIAKRKSLVKVANKKAATKSVTKSTPVATKTPRKRQSAVEHRCDCGQLFSSAALLTRHASLAHTPPRVRRIRDAPPTLKTPRKSSSQIESKTTENKTEIKPKIGKKSEGTKARKSEVETKTKIRKSAGQSVLKSSAKKQEVEPKSTKKEETLAKAAITRKSSIRSDAGKSGASSRKSSVNEGASPVKRPRKELQTESVSKTTTKSAAKLRRSHAGVPVPEKMRKLMEKLKK